MADVITLIAETRVPGRKTGAKAVRDAGRVPGVIYGHGRDPQPLSVGSVELDRLLETITPASTIVEVSIGGKPVKTLIREVQRHPIKQGIVHVDFQEIRADEKVRLEVPVHLTGIPEGVRNQGGVLDQVLRTVEIEVLPADIPERVELDVTALTIGKSLHVSELRIPKATILTGAALTVATVVAPRIEEVAAPAAAAPVEGAVPAEGAPAAVAEPEVIKKGKVEEAEEGAEE
ncbi:MAG: 50S ribosomal protein L25 [Gemmatimonadales bacterium]